MSKVASEAAPNVVVYSSNYCPFCHRAKALLEQKGVDFTEINVDGKPDIRTEMRKKADGRNTVPQIFVGDEAIGGCDDLYALERAGTLDTLLNRAA